jgi:hypothetical protein
MFGDSGIFNVLYFTSQTANNTVFRRMVVSMKLGEAQSCGMAPLEELVYTEISLNGGLGASCRREIFIMMW